MKELTRDTFEAEVLQAPGTIFINFYSNSCVPCKALEPFVREMHQKYGDRMTFAGLNTTKARRLAISQKVLGLPVMAIYKKGEKVEELVKEDCTHENIEAMIQRHL